jgi:hypothetical protein
MRVVPISPVATVARERTNQRIQRIVLGSFCCDLIERSLNAFGGALKGRKNFL